jgi:DNA uptake protein ComE-like DNA-binding protein
MMMSYRSTDNGLAGTEADQAIEGALRYIESVLSNAATPGEVPDVASYESEDVPVGEARFWIIGRSAEQQSTGKAAYGLIDEASKLNVNKATPQTLESLSGMTPEFASAIQDWHDEDPDPGPNGAESETYLLRTPAYSCKDADFESVDELRLVAGADDVILNGEDANQNGILDPNEDDADRTLPTDNGDGKLDAGIRDYVTAFSMEPNTQKDGTARIDGRSRRPELTDYLTAKLGSRGAEIAEKIPPQGGIRSLIEFYLVTDMTADELAKVQGDLSFGDRDNIGLVNVNTASEAVLAAISAIGPENAAKIVAARSKRASTGTDFTWIADDSVLGRPGATAAGPFITGRSFQFSVDIAAVGHHGRGYRRTRFIIDMSTGSPRVIHRQNLAPLGWALGSEVRRMLAERKETR